MKKLFSTLLITAAMTGPTTAIAQEPTDNFDNNGQPFVYLGQKYNTSDIKRVRLVNDGKCLKAIYDSGDEYWYSMASGLLVNNSPCVVKEIMFEAMQTPESTENSSKSE
ncbi:hypothetical protein [Neptuniibacter sp. QD37_11]|uniref:hypothetical protein n=1 Tax=Neptuniibacter sp. QD37_11 TaxID=3398209 RepID=UPI0039F500C7